MANEYDAIIEALLERYLHLLDEYTTLRADLNHLQVSMYQQLARANFTAERGVRYGQDYYDDRMRASRIVSVAVNGDNQSIASETPRFNVVRKQLKIVSASKEDAEKSLSEPAKQQNDSQDEISDSTDGEVENTPESSDSEAKSDDASDTGTHDRSKDDTKDEVEERESSSPKEEQSAHPVDPLRWFGFIAPQPLRQTQSNAVRAVEEIVPRLATVSAEMAHVEIEVRRARKRRAKATASTTEDKAVQSHVVGTIKV